MVLRGRCPKFEHFEVQRRLAAHSASEGLQAGAFLPEASSRHRVPIAASKRRGPSAISNKGNGNAQWPIRSPYMRDKAKQPGLRSPAKARISLLA